jgi:minor extracellular serine protease Vpr
LPHRRLSRPLVGIATAATAVAALTLASAATAENQPDAGSGAEIHATSYTPLSLSTEPELVMVELVGETIAEVQAKQPNRKLSESRKKQIEADLKSKQDAIKPAIANLGGRVLSDFQAAYNGLSVEIARNRIPDLASLSNVIGVHAIQPDERSNAKSVPYIGGPTTWTGPPGFKGQGIKVAIIDTGVDYTHANFGGPGTAGDYFAADATDTMPANPAYFGPGAPKVKGGIDLVGDNYNASAVLPNGQPDLARRTPQPDPNPLDCNGHGSHVAGTAGGFGVLKDSSSRYTGPYDATTHTNDFEVGPGVAPLADIYAVRVFGCTGSTAVTVNAIEWAVDNNMDVINMSLGSSFGTASNPSSVAASNAAKAGIIVVASAGNSGASQYITGSPAAGEGVVSVAANDANPNFPGFTVTISSGTFQAINANNAQVDDGTSYTVHRINDNPATANRNEALGCSVADFTWEGPLPANAMAVVVRGVCARVAKAIFGDQAGAAAVAMIDNSPNLPPFEGRITRNPDNLEFHNVDIPFVGVRGASCAPLPGCLPPTSDGARLRAAHGTSATLVNILLNNGNYTGFAGFTSGGPRNGDSNLKPDITAPGVSTASTGIATGNLNSVISGTSMAAPHVAGVAALVDEAHPGWRSEDLAAAIVNTGNPGAVGAGAATATQYRTSRGGTGLVQPLAATKTQVVAFGPKDIPALNFGFDELKDQLNRSESVMLRNNGSSPATFNVGTSNASGAAHTVSLGQTQITVPARATANLAVNLNVPMSTVGSAAAFREVAGLVTLTPTGGSNNGVTLRVPYYFVPRALSQVEVAVGDSQPDPPTFTTTATVHNQSDSARSGDADFYAWGLEDGDDFGTSPADLRGIGVQSFPTAAAHPAGGPNRLLGFGLSTWNRWSNASTAEYDISVDVDPQNNNGVDYVVVGVDQGAVLAGAFNGVTGSFVFSTRSPGVSFLNASFAIRTDNSTMFLLALASQLCRSGEPCLREANPRFTYSATGFDLSAGGSDPITGTAAFNGWMPAISNGAFLTVPPGGSASAPISIDTAEWALTPAKGIMVLSTDNKSGKDEAALLEVKPD